MSLESKEEEVMGLDEQETSSQEIDTLDEEECVYVLFDDKKIKFTKKMTKNCDFLDAIFDTEEKMCRLSDEFKYNTYENLLILQKFLQIKKNDFPEDVLNFNETLQKTLYHRPTVLSFMSEIKDKQVLDLISFTNYMGAKSFNMFLCYKMRDIIERNNISYIKTL